MAEDKTRPGNKRASIEVQNCFGDLLRWIIDLLPKMNRELPMAIDATNIGQNFTVLSINVLYRRCAIPVAWKVVKGTERGSWKSHWKKLFQALKEIVPQHYLVIVSADRGLYADWLFQEIVALGWHPFLPNCKKPTLVSGGSPRYRNCRGCRTLLIFLRLFVL